MAAHSRKKIAISLLIPSLVFILFFSIMFWQKYRSSHKAPIMPIQQHAESNRSVTLFFATGMAQLTRETRELDPCDDDNACLKSVLDELVNGPVGEFEEAVPVGTTVVAVRVEGNQATIELNRLFSDAMLSGSSAEMLAVYSVVNTVTANFPQIQKVKINVDGNSKVILQHLDLSEPLLPDYSLEQPPRQEPDKTSTKPDISHKRKIR